MEYKRLSTEQFEALHQEFATFLAANSIDKKEWDQLKKLNTTQAENLLDGFSDLVWNDVLRKNLYVEHLNPQHLFLFECLDEQMNLVLVQSEVKNQDFTSPDGFRWLEANLQSDSITLFQSQKKYQNRNHDIFDLIQKGARITEGTYFKSITSFLSNPS